MTEGTGASALLTDLYELTMAAVYHRRGINDTATFSLFTRDAPRRCFFVAAGIDEALQALADWRFSADELDYLARLDFFAPEFLAYLKSFRFSGSVYSLSEGSLFFPNEPVMEVTAPMIDAQLVETFLINTVGFQTLIASKAARCIHAAGGRPLVDFSLRRTQGKDAGLRAARSTYLAGFAATSNLLAGKIYDIPVSGTMAHSYVSAFPSEAEAFEAFAAAFPENAVLLIDTYDTLEGARTAARLAARLNKQGRQVHGVRLDSGDMAGLSRQVREILNDAGFPGIQIFASSGFDEFKISEILKHGGDIDAFGVGTKVGVSADLPYLDMVYKLVRFGKRGILKLSPGKITLAGEKQVFRRTGTDGRMVSDAIGLRGEARIEGTPLLEKRMENGRLLHPLKPLKTLRRDFARDFARFPERYKGIDAAEAYTVVLTPALQALQERVKAALD